MKHAPPPTGARLVYLVCACASWTGCSTDTTLSPNPGERRSEHVETTQSAIYGDDTTRDDNGGGDTFYNDTVVALDNGCSGTLITPTLVLTAAHCACTATSPSFVLVGPHRTPDPATPGNNWKAKIAVQSYVGMSDPPADDADSNMDIALVTLSKPVLWAAFSTRPFSWTSWTLDTEPTGFLVWGASGYQFGIAGWSPYAGPSDCTADPPDPGPTDDEHTWWRQRAQPLDETSFYLGTSDQVVRWKEGNHNKYNKGDSGGPIYKLNGDGSREVIAVASKLDCVPQPDLTWDRIDLYTDVTQGNTAAWILQNADDAPNRSTNGSNWLVRHGRTAGYWKGEVDYLGPCNTDRDQDCDHWYDEHDDCPWDYNPGQEEDAQQNGLACATRSILPFDPNNPTNVDVTTPLGTCVTDSPECPVGFCYFREVSGQYWQKSPQSVSFKDASFIGAWTRIAIMGGQFYRDHHIHPDLANNVFYAPPVMAWDCTYLRDIKSISDPTQCSVSRNSTTFDSNILGSQPSSVALGSDTHTFNVLNGLIGSVAFPGHRTDGRFARVFVTNNASQPLSTFQTFLQNVRDTTTENRDFTGEEYSVSCPGWTAKFAPPVDQTVPNSGANIVVTAFSVPTTVVLVAANSDPGVEPRAETSVCFLNGVGGPWGGWTRTDSTPTAKIYKDPDTGDILMTVTPSGIPGTNQVVEARATCLSLSPNP